MCLGIFMETVNSSQATYDGVCQFIKQQFLDAHTQSYDQMKRTLADLTEVEPLMTDMCSEMCVVFTGPFSDLCMCLECSVPRYETISQGNKRVTVSCKQVLTIPIGPQIQAQYQSRKSVWNMGHRCRVMEPLLAQLHAGGSINVYKDVYCSSILLDAARRGDLTSDDTLLMLSIDGTILYQSKQSGCWIYIWVLLDLVPDLHYKKKYVLPSGFIPGPTNLRILTLLSTLGCTTSRHYKGTACAFETVRPGTSLPCTRSSSWALQMDLAALHGQVGHHGVFGCREYCGLRGCHKPGGPHYYPALRKPLNYKLSGCNYNDIDIYELPVASQWLYLRKLDCVLGRQTDAQFRLAWKETGLCKPSIFMGLPLSHSSRLPGCLAIDHMHIIMINLSDLLIVLWRGSIDCERNDSRDRWDWAMLVGDTWKLHGQDVACCRAYLPGSFDCPPQNPAEKISSGYKAWEVLIYVFGYCPALLCGILP